MPERTTTRRPRLLDLFCGAGGLSLGFQAAGYEIAGGIDSSQSAVATFERTFGGGKGLVKDLRRSDLDDVKDLVGSSGVDLVVGGPSCQGFSTSGGLSKRSGRDQTDPRNRLFLNYLSLVDELQPHWVVFENVPGLLLYNQGRVAIDIVQAFREIGYSLVPMILLAADFGVPQLRRRLVFVGNRTKTDVSFPAATHGDSNLWKNFALPFAHLSRIGHGSGAQAPHITFGEACGDLPAVCEGLTVDGVEYDRPASSRYQAAMRTGSATVDQHFAAELSNLDRIAANTLKPGQNWRDLPVDVLPERFRKIRSYDATTLLKRLRNDRPAYTITTKFNEGTTGAFIHPEQPRTLTLREAARLQSFPDRFRFEGTPAQVRQQIGNAVPPLLGQAIAEAILPDVCRDAFGRAADAIRDVVTVENAFSEADVLRLKAPRRSPDELELPFGVV